MRQMTGAKRKLRVTLAKSPFGRKPGHAQCLAGLGLRRPNQSVLVADTPENRGMMRKVSYLLKIEEA